MKAQFISLLTLIIGQLFNSGTSFGTGGGGGTDENPSLTYPKIAATGTNADVIKPSPGQVTGWAIGNSAGYKVLVSLYNQTTTPDPLVDTPKVPIPVEASLRSDLVHDDGIEFSAGIAITITKMDGSAVAAKDCELSIFYL